MTSIAGTARMIIAVAGLVVSNVATANSLREGGKAVEVAGSTMRITPPRAWNRLDVKPGKFAETWTLDGEQLNDVTFYGGVEAGQALVKERSKKHQPLPKFSQSTLLAEIPELLEGTYRAHRQIGVFAVTASTPEPFLGKPGIRFAYEYTDSDSLPRKGEARAALANGKLYMVTFDAPRPHYFSRSLADFRALADAATLTS